MFFVVGKYVEVYLDLICCIVKDGYEVGNYFYDEKVLVFMGFKYVVEWYE